MLIVHIHTALFLYKNKHQNLFFTWRALVCCLLLQRRISSIFINASTAIDYYNPTLPKETPPSSRKQEATAVSCARRLL
jgi:hypothetical protein